MTDRMFLEKNLQPEFISGYTNGFCDGLSGKGNAHEMTEYQWDSEEILDLESKKLNESFVSDVEYNMKEYQHKYFKTGYNWGYKHGQMQRNVMKNETPADIFESHMEQLSDALRIQFLEVNRKAYTCYQKAMDPREENRVHVDFVYSFVLDMGKRKKDMIEILIGEKKTQQAIEHAVDYFGKLKNLESYLLAITLEADLKNLRKFPHEKDEYVIKKKQIEKRLSELIVSGFIKISASSS